MPFSSHRLHDEHQIFVGVAERALLLDNVVVDTVAAGAVGRDAEAHARHAQQLAAQPVSIRILGRNAALQIVIAIPALMRRIHNEHLARRQAALLDDVRIGNLQHAHF